MHGRHLAAPGPSRVSTAAVQQSKDMVVGSVGDRGRARPQEEGLLEPSDPNAPTNIRSEMLFMAVIYESEMRFMAVTKRSMLKFTTLIPEKMKYQRRRSR